MSEDTNNNTTSSCASCGIAEVDDIKLKNCGGCDLVRYCSDECEREHKSSEHEEACKKRAAELRDELLFTQPESTHDGDCPICYLPLPLDLTQSSMMMCCSKVICNGCGYANYIREAEASMATASCLFCREPMPKSEEECEKRNMERVKANDPVALWKRRGKQQMKGDYTGAVEYYEQAVGFGNTDAHCKLAVMYRDGLGVEKEKGKEIHHLEEAAIGGHPYARYLLGLHEERNGNTERAVKHFIIAATLGLDFSIKKLMDMFKMGFVSKEDLAATLRVHQAAVDATKSPQREAAIDFFLFLKEQGYGGEY